MVSLPIVCWWHEAQSTAKIHMWLRAVCGAGATCVTQTNSSEYHPVQTKWIRFTFVAIQHTGIGSVDQVLDFDFLCSRATTRNEHSRKQKCPRQSVSKLIDLLCRDTSTYMRIWTRKLSNVFNSSPRSAHKKAWRQVIYEPLSRHWHCCVHSFTCETSRAFKCMRHRQAFLMWFHKCNFLSWLHVFWSCALVDASLRISNG